MPTNFVVYVLTTDIATFNHAQRQIAGLARTDALTGLPDRREFNEALTVALARTRHDTVIATLTEPTRSACAEMQLIRDVGHLGIQTAPWSTMTCTMSQDAKYTRAQPWLGTLVAVSIPASRDDASICEYAFDRIRTYHRAMSFQESNSDVRAIARARPGERVQLAPETWEVLHAALSFEAESDGHFCVAVGSSLVERGLLSVPDDLHAGCQLATSAQTALRLDDEGGVTVLESIWLDLGGIAKGAAVDAALQALRDAGADAAVVNAGGDLATYGFGEQTIEVIGPRRRRVAAGTLVDGAVATSGPFVNASESTGRRDYVACIANAGWTDRSVTVVAPTCLVADALTKVVLGRGRGAAAMLARHAAHAFSIDATGAMELVA